MTATASASTYAAFMDATWRLIYSSEAGRAELLREAPADVRELLVRSQADCRDLDFERARRRRPLTKRLRGSFRLTYFAFAATEGTEGIMRFMESPEFGGRSGQSGAAFPSSASTARAFAAYVERVGWAARQRTWLQDAFRFERAYLFGAHAGLVRRAGAVGIALADAAWVAEAGFDVHAAGRTLWQQGQEYPWLDALHYLQPAPVPYAVISLRGEKLKRIALGGASVTELRWLWDERADVPGAALTMPAVTDAIDAGLVRTFPADD